MDSVMINSTFQDVSMFETEHVIDIQTYFDATPLKSGTRITEEDIPHIFTKKLYSNDRLIPRKCIYIEIKNLHVKQTYEFSSEHELILKEEIVHFMQSTKKSLIFKNIETYSQYESISKQINNFPNLISNYDENNSCLAVSKKDIVNPLFSDPNSQLSGQKIFSGEKIKQKNLSRNNIFNYKNPEVDVKIKTDMSDGVCYKKVVLDFKNASHLSFSIQTVLCKFYFWIIVEYFNSLLYLPLVFSNQIENNLILHLQKFVELKKKKLGLKTLRIKTDSYGSDEERRLVIYKFNLFMHTFNYGKEIEIQSFNCSQIFGNTFDDIREPDDFIKDKVNWEQLRKIVVFVQLDRKLSTYATLVLSLAIAGFNMFVQSLPIKGGKHFCKIFADEIYIGCAQAYNLEEANKKAKENTINRLLKVCPLIFVKKTFCEEKIFDICDSNEDYLKWQTDQTANIVNKEKIGVKDIKNNFIGDGKVELSKLKEKVSGILNKLDLEGANYDIIISDTSITSWKKVHKKCIGDLQKSLPYLGFSAVQNRFLLWHIISTEKLVYDLKYANNTDDLSKYKLFEPGAYDFNALKSFHKNNKTKENKVYSVSLRSRFIEQGNLYINSFVESKLFDNSESECDDKNNEIEKIKNQEQPARFKKEKKKAKKLQLKKQKKRKNLKKLKVMRKEEESQLKPNQKQEVFKNKMSIEKPTEIRSMGQVPPPICFPIANNLKRNDVRQSNSRHVRSFEQAHSPGKKLKRGQLKRQQRKEKRLNLMQKKKESKLKQNKKEVFKNEITMENGTEMRSMGQVPPPICFPISSNLFEQAHSLSIPNYAMQNYFDNNEIRPSSSRQIHPNATFNYATPNHFINEVRPTFFPPNSNRSINQRQFTPLSPRYMYRGNEVRGSRFTSQVPDYVQNYNANWNASRFSRRY